jgi:transposase-like protein
MAVVIAVGVHANGRREVLDLDMEPQWDTVGDE